MTRLYLDEDVARLWPPLTPVGTSVVLNQKTTPPMVGAVCPGAWNAGHNGTGSVIHSPRGNLMLTAGHVLGPGSRSVFVPGFYKDTAPYGVWEIEKVWQTPGWIASRAINEDFSFVTLKPNANGQNIEEVTGAYSIAFTGEVPEVQITALPGNTESMITGTGTARLFQPGQLVVSLKGYPDGTSGSAWLADYDPATGAGSAVGCLGGYLAGGSGPDVSYAAAFGPVALGLYLAAAK